MARIVDIQLVRVNERLAERGLTLAADDAARRRLAELGWDPAFGARPLKRAIQSLVEDPIAEFLLDRDGGNEGETGLLTLSVIDGRLSRSMAVVVENDGRPQGFKAPARPSIGFALVGGGSGPGGSAAGALSGCIFPLPHCGREPRPGLDPGVVGAPATTG